MVRGGGSGYISGMDKQIPLSLKASDDGAEGAQNADPAAQEPAQEPALKDQPVIGYLAVICGVFAIFAWGIVFVPMGLAFSVAALIAGQGAWGFAGLVLSVIGLMTSPTLLALLGLGAVAAFFGLG
tara:strand:+ start:70 stop:447 length:378 start_codon:yes stop_codon:yes gene_type:complete